MIAVAHARASRHLNLSALALVVASGLALVIVARAMGARGFLWEDDYAHLLIARAVARAPLLALSVWGRPAMTLAYVPGAQVGELAVRVTSLVLLGLTALLCWRVAVALRLPASPAAAILLIAQPATAAMGFAALPGIPFSFLLGVALWLRVSRRAGLAALVASFLPLARLEGLLVLAVWGTVLVFERRFRLLPLLAAGMFAWAGAGALVFGDAAWLLHQNPYRFVGSPYAAAGWRYLFAAWPVAFGPIVGGLALASLLWWRAQDRLVLALAVGLPAFYAITWTVPLFSSIATPLYLVSASVPVALCAHQALAGLLSPPGRTSLSGGGAAALAVLATAERQVRLAWVAMAGTVGLVVLTSRWRVAQPVARAAVVAALLLAALFAVKETSSLPLQGEPMLAKQLAERTAVMRVAVTATTEPAFAWYARDRNVPLIENLHAVYRQQPVGAALVWDSQLGQPQVSEADLRAAGYRALWSAANSGGRLVLWQRFSQATAS